MDGCAGGGVCGRRRRPHSAAACVDAACVVALDAIVKELASHPGVLRAIPDTSSLNVACDAEQYHNCHASSFSNWH